MPEKKDDPKRGPHGKPRSESPRRMREPTGGGGTGKTEKPKKEPKR